MRHHSLYRLVLHAPRMLPLLLILVSLHTSAQYAPAAGISGSAAIPASADSVVLWASGCTVLRGLQDIAVPGSGVATAGDSAQAIGPAGGNTIVSLGDGGVATLTFDHAIVNRPGFDFAVFENGFSPSSPEMAFLELGFVEVSSDGLHFVRFLSIDDTQDTIQIGNGGTMDARRLNNLAGKYVNGYGTPFDLEELKDSSDLDVNHITHVRVRDVVGSLDPAYASYDSRSRKINDPYPTPFASCGFDLDAVGVMHADGITGTPDISIASISMYPNPVESRLYIQTYTHEPGTLILCNVAGQALQTFTFSGATGIDMSAYSMGIYRANIVMPFGSFSHLIIKQ